MFEQKRLSYDPSHATWAEEFGEGNEQMDRQDQDIAHERKVITSADQLNTSTLNLAVIPVRNYEFATHSIGYFPLRC